MSLAGALIYITKWPLAPYIFMVGSILVAIAQIFSPPKKSSVNIRRLHRQQVFGALLLVATGPLMIFLQTNGSCPLRWPPSSNCSPPSACRKKKRRRRISEALMATKSPFIPSEV